VIQLITYGYFVIYSGIHLNFPVDSPLLQHFQIITYISAYATDYFGNTQQCQRARIGLRSYPCCPPVELVLRVPLPTYETCFCEDSHRLIRFPHHPEKVRRPAMSLFLNIKLQHLYGDCIVP
jgi:hypothetical protein